MHKELIFDDHKGIFVVIEPGAAITEAADLSEIIVGTPTGGFPASSAEYRNRLIEDEPGIAKPSGWADAGIIQSMGSLMDYFGGKAHRDPSRTTNSNLNQLLQTRPDIKRAYYSGRKVMERQYGANALFRNGSPQSFLGIRF